MTETLPQLENQRAQVVEGIAGLGDFRRGSITSITGRCGKANCHCHQPGRPGHGPNFRLTRKVQGKTVSETFSRLAQGGARGGGAPQVSGAESDPDRGQRKDLPVASGGRGTGLQRAGTKTAEAIREEIAREVDQFLPVVFQDRRRTGRLDLEATEMAVRSALHRASAAALSQLLRFPAPSEEQRSVACPCGQQARYHQLRTKPVLTAVGPVEVSRPYYWCPDCRAGQVPAHVELDIEDTEFSPGVRRMQGMVGQEAPFDHGREQMKVLAGLEVTAKSVERTAEALGTDIAQGEQGEIQKALQLDLPVVASDPIPILYVQMDGTGVPVVKKETLGRQGKTEGQPAHTREVKLGCVFTQTGWDKKGYPIRDPDSTTYTGAIETAEDFGKRLYREVSFSTNC